MNNHTAARDSKRALAFLLSAVMVAAMFFAAMPQNAYAEEGAGPATDASVIPATEDVVIPAAEPEGVEASDPSPIVSSEDTESDEEVTALEGDGQKNVIELTFTDSGTATIYNKWTTPIIVNGGDQTDENVDEDSSIEVSVSDSTVVTITESANDTFREWENSGYPLVENVDCELTAIPAMNVFTEDTAGAIAGSGFFRGFNNGGALTSLPAGSFDTAGITIESGGFFSDFNTYGALTSLPDGSFDTSGITDVGSGFFSHFNDSGSLTSLPEGSFDASNIATVGDDFFSHFNDCGDLTSLPVGSFNTSDITTAGDYFFDLFNNLGALRSLPTGSFDISGITSAGFCFFNGFGSDDMTSLPDGSFDTSNITSVDDHFFSNFTSFGALESLPEGSFDISGITSAGDYFFDDFNYMGALESLPEGSFNTSKITTVGVAFFSGFNCHGNGFVNSEGALTSLPEGSFDTSKITTVGAAFFGSFNSYGSLTSLPAGSFDTSKITTSDGGSFYNFNKNGALTQGNKGVTITNNSNQTITNFSTVTDLPGTISTGGGKAYINASYIPVPTKYAVTFNANGGSNVSGREVTANAAIGALPQAARTGYAFKGWYTAAAGGAKIEASALVTAAVTYYAQWTANSYTVTHNVNGGKALSSKAKTKTVKYDSAYGELAKTTRDGYTFKGWYTAKSGGTKITNTTKVQTAKDHTLHAQWTAKTITATFNANGGKVSPVGGGSKAKTTKMKVTYAQKFGKLPVPTRAGYKFSGWYTAKSGGTKITKTTVVKITKNTTYYARWTKK